MDPFQVLEPFSLLSLCVDLHKEENHLNNNNNTTPIWSTKCALDTILHSFIISQGSDLRCLEQFLNLPQMKTAESIILKQWTGCIQGFNSLSFAAFQHQEFKFWNVYFKTNNAILILCCCQKNDLKYSEKKTLFEVLKELNKKNGNSEPLNFSSNYMALSGFNHCFTELCFL